MGLPSLAGVCFLFVLHISSASVSLSQSILRYLPETNASLSADEFPAHRNNITLEDYLFCDSWRYNVEVDNPGVWTEIPLRCQTFVREYMASERYRSDCEAVAYYALEFAKSVEVSADGKDAWVFDVDETLISNVDYFLGHGVKPDGKQSVYQWPPAIPSSLRLYNEIRKLNFKVFLLTGRDKSVRLLTLLNLAYAGYRNWDRLILRGHDDIGTLASVYKSKKRQELVDEGYRIRGNMGDQWSDLIGYAVGERSFKMPNPMYYAA